MSLRELPGKRIQVAHALDGDEKSFVARQARVVQRLQLVPEMSLKFFHVGAVKNLAPSHVSAPLRDLLLQRRIARHAGHAFSQIPRSVSSTTCHCRCCAASCARPSDVIR